jgi:hypothetical protein
MDDDKILSSNITEEGGKEPFKSFSKFDHDLYKEEDDVVLPLVRVKLLILPSKGCRWKIFSDNKVVFVLEGSKFLKKECEYLQTLEGFNFILAQAKLGIKSLHNFQVELKKKTAKPRKEKTKKATKKTKPAKIKKRGRGRPRKVQ